MITGSQLQRLQIVKRSPVADLLREDRRFLGVGRAERRRPRPTAHIQDDDKQGKKMKNDGGAADPDQPLRKGLFFRCDGHGCNAGKGYGDFKGWQLQASSGLSSILYGEVAATCRLSHEAREPE